ncbi:MAG: hypothetical protein IJ615_11235 [Bacteroidaceae bacterium]|nr:hypothetical protein [Bacteroidaceae bacterium]
MTQIEFEEQKRELHIQFAQERNQIGLWQAENKQEIAEAKKRLAEVKGLLSKLEAQKQMLAQRRLDCQTKWGERINKFRRENFSTSRELQNISDFGLVNELRKRGWRGQLGSEAVGMSQEHIDKVNAKLNGQ